jgi:hypothetical protein
MNPIYYTLPDLILERLADMSSENKNRRERIWRNISDTKPVFIDNKTKNLTRKQLFKLKFSLNYDNQFQQL